MATLQFWSIQGISPAKLIRSFTHGLMRALIRWLFTMMKSVSLQSSEDADRAGATKVRKNDVPDLAGSQYKNSSPSGCCWAGNIGFGAGWTQACSKGKWPLIAWQIRRWPSWTSAITWSLHKFSWLGRAPLKFSQVVHLCILRITNCFFLSQAAPLHQQPISLPRRANCETFSLEPF